MQDPIFLGIQSRGTLALPPGLRRRLGLDQPGAQVEVVVREDGVIELHPYAAVPRDAVVDLNAEDSEFFSASLLTPQKPSTPLRRATLRRRQMLDGR